MSDTLLRRHGSASPIEGALGEKCDQRPGFGLAAAGMAVGYLACVRGGRHLSAVDLSPRKPLSRSHIRFLAAAAAPSR